MKAVQGSLSGSVFCRTLIALVLAASPGSGLLWSQGAEDPIEPLFNWDLVSLEQNNQRFNGSILTGFHSIRSAGVTPLGGWKLGMGLLYTGEEQFVRSVGDSLFRRNEGYLNPKLNMGLFEDVELGAGLVAAYANGRELVDGPGGPFTEDREEGVLSSADLGVKWKFYDDRQLRFA